MTATAEALPRWLTLTEAAAYCPYNKGRLKELVREGKIKGGRQTDKKSEDWFLDRHSIDEYMESMCNPSQEQIRQKVLALMRKVR